MTNALKFVDGIIVELTGEEKAAIEAAVEAYRQQELKRPLEPKEVSDLLAKKLVNEVEIDDQTSLRMKSYYPTFDEIVDTEVKEGFKFTYKDELWKTRQKHTPQAIYPPSVETTALYERIDETHLGTIDDPIPYDQTMVVYNGKYYSYAGVIYLCIRDSGVPLYAEPGSLLGNYFEEAGSTSDSEEPGGGEDIEEPATEPDGTKENPYPYDQSKAVTNGTYYIYNDIVYLCIRDSGNALYAEPGSLLGNYFQLAE